MLKSDNYSQSVCVVFAYSGLLKHKVQVNAKHTNIPIM